MNIGVAQALLPVQFCELHTLPGQLSLQNPHSQEWLCHLE